MALKEKTDGATGGSTKGSSESCGIFTAAEKSRAGVHTARYDPDPRIVSQLGPALKGKKIVIFTGLWCKDCNEGIPKVKAVLGALKPQPDVQLYELERGPFTHPEMKRLSVTAIPTLIILAREKEIGRIVEFPKITWEEDMLRICVG